MHILFCVNKGKPGTKCFLKMEQFVLPFVAEWNNFANSIGMNPDDIGNRMNGLFDLTAEQLATLQRDAPTFWAKLDGDVREYLEQIIACNEEIKNSMLFVLGSLSSLCTTASDSNLLLTDMRNLAVMSNGHLEDIAKYTKVLLGFGEKLDNIDRNTKNI